MNSVSISGFYHGLIADFENTIEQELMKYFERVLNLGDFRANFHERKNRVEKASQNGERGITETSLYEVFECRYRYISIKTIVRDTR